jgi:TonB-dependent receptor
MKKEILTVLLILSSILIFAQTATLRGKIIDASTGEELVGATVQMAGTSIGASADLDGNYSVTNIEPGTYDVICKYISYESQTISGFKFSGDNIEILNFKLQPASLDLLEVVIQARKVNRTEAALLTIQRKSANMVDGISAQQISKSGDSDAASALKRVTGLSVEGGKYVYVRGLGDRYMMVTLNGAQIPGLDPNKNTVQMDLFPSNVLENMVVSKTFSPELPGSFTGGLVNVVTRDFPEKFTFGFSTSVGYNTNASLNKDFLSYDGGSTDWLGFDDGTRDIPDAAQGNIPKFTGDVSADYSALTDITKSFNKTWVPEKKESYLNQSHSISVGNQISLFGKSFGFVAAISYSREYKYYDNGQIGNYKLIGDNSTQLEVEYDYADKLGTVDVLWAAILSGSYKLSNNHKIGIMYLRNQSGQDDARSIFGLKPEDDQGFWYQSNTLSYLERSFNSVQLNGKHYFENILNLKSDWILSYTKSKQSRPDLRYFANNFTIQEDASDALTDTIFEISPSLYPVPTRFYREMTEDNIDAKINFELPFEFLGQKSKVKFGGSFTKKNRDQNDKRFDFNDGNSSFTTFHGNINDYFGDGNIGQDAITWPSKFGLYASNEEIDDLANSYTADQTVSAAYGMLDLKFFNKLKILAGARIEITDLNVGSLIPDEEKTNLSETDILPAINLNYELGPDMNLRAAYTKTLARPTFRELAPFASFDFLGSEIIVGNPDLKRTLVDNLDLRWEFYPAPGEIISFSTFYKHFTNPIEKTFNVEAANPELTWRNQSQAKVYGFEAEIRKSLGFVPALRNFKLGANFTYVMSEVDVDPQELYSMRLTEPDAPDTRVMAGQSPYIINTMLSFNSDSLGLSANLSYNISGRRLHIVIVGGTPNIFEQPAGQLNFNVNKKLGKNWSLKIAAKNLLNPVFKQTYTRWDEESTWKGEEYIYRSYQKGITYSVGITYLIN